jgi:hypothetical protein
MIVILRLLMGLCVYIKFEIEVGGMLAALRMDDLSAP